MEPIHRRNRRRRNPIKRRLRSFTRVQMIVSLVTMIASVVAVVALLLLLNQRPAAPPPIGSSPPLKSTPIAGAPTLPPGLPETSRLVVPSGHIDLRVVEGDGVHVPLNLAMHYPGTSEPGAGSNSLFYAHAQPGMFLGLYDVHVGDEVRVIRADGSQILYQVRTLRKVSYDDTSVLKATPFEEVTMLTCTSYNPYNPRYIVTATPV